MPHAPTIQEFQSIGANVFCFAAALFLPLSILYPTARPPVGDYPERPSALQGTVETTLVRHILTSPVLFKRTLRPVS